MSQRLNEATPAGIVVAVFGLLFLVAYLGYILVDETYHQGPRWLLPLGILLVGVLSAGLLWGGHWLARSSFKADEGWRVAIWTMAGLIAALALTFWPIFYQRLVGVTIEDPIFILLVASGLGANAGLVAGIAEMESERRYRRVEEAGEMLHFLNRLLRHNISNAVTVIKGSAKLLRLDVPGEPVAEHTAAIEEQSNQIDDLIDDVSLLASRRNEDRTFEPTNLTAAVAHELSVAETSFDGVGIERDLHEDVYVLADPLVSTIAENLLGNAIVHNDRDEPDVSVSLERRNGLARLRIADDGPGFDRSEQTAVADGGIHGLGLYIVETLVDEYGGEIVFDDNEPRGTVVTVELPLAD